MTRNFHRWEVDPFFCAAEEVQDSADRLESVYRTWLHVKSVADDISAIEFHEREFSTALGTAKWQLEEFERAVSCVIVKDCDQGDDDARSRHKQFVDALQNQINTIERTLSSGQDCKDSKPHQRLRLGDKEKDDLALFLCGSSSSIENKVGDCIKLDKVGPSSRVPLDHEYGGARSRLSMLAGNADIDFRNPSLDTCQWRRDTSNSEKLLADLNYTEIRSFCGRKIDEVSKPVSDPTPDHFQSDKGEPCVERTHGHHRSISLGSGLNAWKCGSMTDVKRKRQTFMSTEISSSRLSFWDILAKVCYKRKSYSGLKRWKDGDANARDSETLALMQDAHDIEQGNGTLSLKAKKMSMNCNNLGDLAIGNIKHQTTLQDGLQIWWSRHYALPFGRLIQIGSAILVALGLVGLLSFHVTSSSL